MKDTIVQDAQEIVDLVEQVSRCLVEKDRRSARKHVTSLSGALERTNSKLGGPGTELVMAKPPRFNLAAATKTAKRVQGLALEFLEAAKAEDSRAVTTVFPELLLAGLFLCNRVE